MSLPRFFLTRGWDGGQVPLLAADLHHLAAVLRAAVGDEIVLVEPEGRQVVARLNRLSEDGAVAESVRELDAPWLPATVLVQGIAKNPRMDVAVEKATELGVAEIVPFLAERSVVRLDKARGHERQARWQRVAVAAAKQSRRATVPTVTVPCDVECLASVIAGVDHVLIFDEDGPAPGVGAALTELGARSRARVAAVVGPEGGLTPQEVAVLQGMGGRRVSLGPTVLRTETAGPVAVALIAYELGGLGGVTRD